MCTGLISVVVAFFERCERVETEPKLYGLSLTETCVPSIVDFACDFAASQEVIHICPHFVCFCFCTFALYQ